MKHIYILLCVASLFFTACEKKDEQTSISGLSSDYVLKLGWNQYLKGNYDSALPYFLELTTRPNAYLKGYHALGWTYFRLKKIVNSDLQFNQFFETDSLQTMTPSDSLYLDVKAGQSFIAYLESNYNESLSLSGQIPNSWQFSRDFSLNYLDIMVLKAICYYNLQQYSQSLAIVKELDPVYSVDLTFIEGIIQLGNKIEQLKAIYRFDF
jgi:hypothetical protein